MPDKREHIFPRNFNFTTIKNYLFPDFESVDPRLKKIFYRQAAVSLFLIMITVAALSAFIFIISLGSNIDTFVLVRTLIVIAVAFVVVMALYKFLRGEKRDYRLLIFTVFFLATWGVVKDIVNFGVIFNSYGILYVTLLFFAMVFMPFPPKTSLKLGAYCTFLYLVLWLVFVQRIFGEQWILNIADTLDMTWLKRQMDFISSGDTPLRHFKFYTAWQILQYILYGALAFVFRAANVQSFIKAFKAEMKVARTLLGRPEGQRLEFKSSARWDYHTKKTNKELEKAIIKTIAGFMNSEGGVLFIGVDDEGDALGLEKDYASLRRKDADGYEAFLIGLISEYIGPEHYTNVNIAFIDVEGREICSIDIDPLDEPLFIEKMDGAFFVRTGNNTQELNTQEAHEYIEKHFG